MKAHTFPHTSAGRRGRRRLGYTLEVAFTTATGAGCGVGMAALERQESAAVMLQSASVATGRSGVVIVLPSSVAHANGQPQRPAWRRLGWPLW